MAHDPPRFARRQVAAHGHTPNSRAEVAVSRIRRPGGKEVEQLRGDDGLRRSHEDRVQLWGCDVVQGYPAREVVPEHAAVRSKVEGRPQVGV